MIKIIQHLSDDCLSAFLFRRHVYYSKFFLPKPNFQATVELLCSVITVRYLTLLWDFYLYTSVVGMFIYIEIYIYIYVFGVISNII